MLAIRIPVAFSAGLLLSVAVFLGLWHLIGTPLDVGPRTQATTVEFTPQIIERPAESKRALKPERQPPVLTPRTGVTGPGETTITGVTLTPTAVAPIVRTGGLTLAGTDHDTLPLVRVPPVYPPAAQRNGVEGWVQVQFSVTAAGGVRDATVVASEPGTVFDGAALAAVERWRYNPRIEGGMAVERIGLQTTLRFRLED